MCVPMRHFSEGLSRLVRLRKRLSVKRADLFISFLVTAIALVLFAFSDLSKSHHAGIGFLHNIELRSLDARFVLRGPRPHDENIVIVGLEENTLQKVGAFPIPRDAYAKMVDQLAKGGAKVCIAAEASFAALGVPRSNVIDMTDACLAGIPDVGTARMSARDDVGAWPARHCCRCRACYALRPRQYLFRYTSHVVSGQTVAGAIPRKVRAPRASRQVTPGRAKARV